MKKLVLVIILFHAFSANSQESFERRVKQDNFLLKTSPFSVLVGPMFPFSSQFGLTAEVVHGYNQSTTLSVAYLGKGILLDALSAGSAVPVNIDEWIFRGFRVQLGHRFYLFRSVKSSELAPSGLYLGPHASFASMRISDPFLNQFQTYLRGAEFNTKVLLGLQVDLLGLYVDFNVGLGYKKNFWQETQGTQTSSIPLNDLGYGDLYMSNLKMHFGFETGFAF